MARPLDLESPLGVLLAGTLTGGVLGAVIVATAILRSCGGTSGRHIEPPSAPATRRELVFPVDGVSVSHLQDTYGEARGTRVHAALDIMAPRGTPVRAVDDGRVTRFSRGAAAGIALDLVDTAGRYCYYYAHLDGYAPGLAEGQTVVRGQVIAFVGATGNAPARSPHLHFAVFELPGGTNCFSGPPVNPHKLLRGE